MPLGMEVGLDPGHIVLDGEPTPHPKGHSPQCSAHVYCGQTAGWIKMPLGTEVDLSSGDIVLDGDSDPRKGHNMSVVVTCYGILDVFVSYLVMSPD